MNLKTSISGNELLFVFLFLTLIYKSLQTEVFLLVILGFPIKAATLVYVGQLYDFVEPYDRIKSAWNVHLPRLICFIPDCYAMILCFASDLGEFSLKRFDQG